MQRRMKLTATILAIVGLAATACGSSTKRANSASTTAAGSAPTTVAGQPRRGGTLTMGQFSPIATFDPAQESINNGEFAALYGDLMHFDNQTDTYVGDLLQSATPNAGSTVWTLKVRPNVKFSDGTPFDAQAIVENFTRDMSPKSFGPASGELSNWVQSMSAPDALTAVITLKSPLADFPYVLSDYPTYIAAPSYINQVAAGNTNATPIGAGPFKLSSFRPNEEITMAPNDNYYGGAPYLAGLKFVYIPGGPATLQAFQTGELQAALIEDRETESQVTQKHIAHVGDFSDIANSLLLNNRPKGSPGGSVLSDVRLRQAVALAFNDPVFNERVFQGLGSNTTTLFPQGSRWYDPSMQGTPYDPAKAKQLVQEVKQQTGWNGSITFACANAPDQQSIPIAVKSMLDPVGFNVTIKNSLNENQFITDVIVSPSYDIACWGLDAPDGDPVADLYRTFHSGSTGNYSAVSSPQMDAALGQMAIAQTPSQTKAGLAKFNTAWNATVPEVNIGSGEFMTIYQSSVHGIDQSSGSRVDFAKVWVS